MIRERPPFEKLFICGRTRSKSCPVVYGRLKFLVVSTSEAIWYLSVGLSVRPSICPGDCRHLQNVFLVVLACLQAEQVIFTMVCGCVLAGGQEMLNNTYLKILLKLRMRL